ncbi:MAG TPA: homoserine dehydrogenase, partial [Allocoleopsis sp.]
IEPAKSLILTAIAHKKHVVTANKAVISRYGDEIFTAANEAGVYVLLEAAVGGGIPIIQPLKQSLGVNRLQGITGIVNGTTNYILTRMQNKEGEFTEILADAQKLGYAEADPSADVDGHDAADKIAILAALAFGGRIKRDDVYTEGISKITATDINYADRLGFVIKLLAIAKELPANEEIISVRVHPTLVPKNHPLASINGVYNAIFVEGEPIGQVMFYGRGAGSGPTASAVVSDIMSIAALLHSQTDNISPSHPLLSCPHQHYCKIASIEDLYSRFYVRFLCEDVPGVIGKLGTCFGDNHVSLESVVQIGFQGNLAEIVIVTHDVREGNVRKALADINKLDFINSIPSILRVL